MISEKNNCLIYQYDNETVQIEAWGKNAVRIRATMNASFTGHDWALEEKPESLGEIQIYDDKDASAVVYANMYSGKNESFGSLTNGKITATVNADGVISFYNQDKKLLLKEQWKRLKDTPSMPLNVYGREFKAVAGDSFRTVSRFIADDDEKIFGMGQYQQKYMNMKGCMLELAQRNSQVSVPFYVSSIGYGFLWNNPAVGRVTFGINGTEWLAECTKELDYLVIAGDTPAEIEETYMGLVGKAPMMPDYGMGFWQCKLRYQTQEQLLEVARKYKSLGLPLDVIVVDFFHWTQQGEYKFDEKYWPDPKAMVDELHSMGIKVIVSVWPSVDRKSENFWPMLDRGLLIKTERGALQTYDFQGDCVEIDVFNPETRKYVWEVCKKNYYDFGIDAFWMDNSEPDFGVYDFDHYRYIDGPALSCSNIYPQLYSRVFYDGMKAEGEENIVNLLRCAWAGSQKYGNVVWSGDVPSTFEAFYDQLQAGLNMGLAGIPWWTTDIGGFMTDDVNDPDFQQLLIRWYEFAVYSAVFRMHGDRGPHNIPPLDDRDFGGGYLYTGQSNELWSYGEENYQIMKKYYDIRIRMHDYIKQLYDEASENGSPLIRTMFYEFPDDKKCWELQDQYMFGSEYLVAPIFHLNEFEREVYLPEGRWEDTRDGKVYEGGQTIRAAAPIDSIPVFKKMA